jgi:hypothetical protein
MTDLREALVTPATLDAAIAGDTAALRDALGPGVDADRVVDAITRPLRRCTLTVADGDGVRRTRGFVGADASVLHADGDDRDGPVPLVVLPSGAEAAHTMLVGVGFGARPEPPLRWPVAVDTPHAVVEAARTGRLAPLGLPDPPDEPVRWWAVDWDDGAGHEVVAVLDADGWWEHRDTELVPTTADALWRRLAPFAAGPAPRDAASA